MQSNLYEVKSYPLKDGVKKIRHNFKEKILSHSENKGMETLKETNAQEKIASGYKLVSLEPVEFHGIELPFLPEESPLMKAPSNYQENYTALELPLEFEEIYETIETEAPETAISSKETFLSTLRADLTSMLEITKVEAEETLPFLEIKKEVF